MKLRTRDHFLAYLNTICGLLFLASGIAVAQTPDSRASYLANEGLMVVHGDTKVLFDPLFSNSYGQYQLLPAAMKQALFNGKPPFQGIDAVFISHYHGDHFSPPDILRLLKAQPGIYLYAPMQAVTAMHQVADEQDHAVFGRVTPIELNYGDAPITLEMQGLLIEAVRIPHSGWPNTRVEVENISWRVTLDETTTVLHMGDADPNDIHFSRDAAYWDKRATHMAFPPYWFFMSANGRDILRYRLRPGHSVGVHVPVSVPADPSRRPGQLQAYDLFTEPGESRRINPGPPLGQER